MTASLIAILVAQASRGRDHSGYVARCTIRQMLRGYDLASVEGLLAESAHARKPGSDGVYVLHDLAAAELWRRRETTA